MKKNDVYNNYIRNRVAGISPSKDAKILDLSNSSSDYRIKLKGLVNEVHKMRWDSPLIETIMPGDFDIVIMENLLNTIPVKKREELLDILYEKVEEIIVYEYTDNKESAMKNNSLFRPLHVQSDQALYVKNIDRVFLREKRDKNSIVVYAIAKNEESFVDTWMDSMSEADWVVVLDTGSEDKTVEKLKARGAIVETKIIDPWRFDHARNESMKLIPEEATIAVCTDLDEAFEPGWAEIISSLWNGHDKGQYLYSWSHDVNGKPETQMWYKKIHANNSEWSWDMPVHEVLYNSVKSDSEINQLELPTEFHLRHNMDLLKSRSGYIKLMEEAVKEDPDDFMQNWYYGRELFFYNRIEESVEQLRKVRFMESGFSMPVPRSGSMIFLGKALIELGEYDEAEEVFIHAMRTYSHTRDPHIKLLKMYFDQKRWHAMIDLFYKIEKISFERGAWYENRGNFREIPHDYVSIAYWNIGDFEKSLKHAEIAYKYKPEDDRIRENYLLIKKHLESIKGD